MRNKLVYAFIAVLFSTPGLAFAQPILTNILPSDLDLVLGQGSINQEFDISSDLGQADGSTFLTITNGFVSATSDNWTVGEFDSTQFSVSSIFGVNAGVLHGANLGSEAQQNGSLSRDGLIAAAGETWTLVSDLDADYDDDVIGDNYFVDYVGAETNQLESNSVAFRWESDAPVSSFTVFSSNTVDLNNNFSLFLGEASAVPEPASAALLGIGACFFMLRRRRRES